MLPSLTEKGDLPAGVHTASWPEVAERFGRGSATRLRALDKLKHLRQLAIQTGKLERLLVFGSFVSNRDNPRDLDLVLIMAADFKLEEAPRESQTLFSHADAEARYGASIFWLRERMVPKRMMDDFMDLWQTKRDGTRRGIVEIEI